MKLQVKISASGTPALTNFRISGGRVTKLLIDGDVLAYRAGFATEKTKYLVLDFNGSSRTFDDAKGAKSFADDTQASVWTRKELEPEDKALMLVDIMVGDIRARYPTLDPVVCLTGVGNFRNVVATRATYKGNRSGTVPPSHLKAIRQHLVSKGAIVSAGEEADDLIGIAATSNPGSVVCSIDKDLLQLPGTHYNFATKEEKRVTPKEAVISFYAQVLSGDQTDNVPGIPGIGAVKSRKALENCKTPRECWQVCRDLYYAEFDGLGGKYALEAARLVYVRRKVNEMWEPPYAAAKT